MTKTTRIAKASLQIFILGMIGRLIGFVQQIIVAHEFGIKGELDAFLIAQSVPSFFLQIMLVGSLGASFIPIFKKYQAGGREKEGWQLINSLLNLTILGSIVFAVLTSIFIDPITNFFAPGLDSERRILAHVMALQLLPIIPFASATGILRSIANMEHSYALPAIAATIGSIINLLLTWLLAPIMGITTLVVANIAMSVIVALLTYIFVYARGYRYDFVLNIKQLFEHDILKSIPSIWLFTIMNIVMFYSNRWFASFMSVGQISILAYAWRFEPIIVGGIGSAVATPLLTELAENIASDNISRARERIISSIRLVSLAVIPICIFMIIFSKELVALLFAHGKFTPENADEVAAVLRIVVGSLLIWSYATIQNQYLFATRRWKAPAFIGAGNVLLILVINIFVYRPFGIIGLAWVTTLTSLIFAYVGWSIVVSDLGNIWHPMKKFILRLGISVGIMIVSVKISLFSIGTIELNERIVMLASIGVGGIVFICSCFILKVEELLTIKGKIVSVWTSLKK